MITDPGNARACTLSTARSYMLGAAKVGMPEVNAASWRPGHAQWCNMLQPGIVMSTGRGAAKAQEGDVVSAACNERVNEAGPANCCAMRPLRGGPVQAKGCCCAAGWSRTRACAVMLKMLVTGNTVVLLLSAVTRGGGVCVAGSQWIPPHR